MAYLNASFAISDQCYGFELPATFDLPDVSRTFALTEMDRDNVLEFLSRRPLHTAKLASLILDNGIENDANKGTFYAYHDRFGELDGVALIGEDTFFETRSDEAFAALAFTASKFADKVKRIHSMDDLAIDLWVKAFGAESPAASIEHNEIFELSFPVPVMGSRFATQMATSAELDEVAQIQARSTAAMTGIDPLTVNGTAFIAELEKLIEQGRVILAKDADRIVFLAQLSVVSADAVILDRLFVSDELAASGEAASLLARTGVELAAEVKHVCVKDAAIDAEMLAKAGFRFTACTTTVTV